MRTQETTRQTARPSTSKIWRFNGVAAAVAVALGGLAAVPGQAFAAAPAANSTIGNTASASYTDASAWIPTDIIFAPCIPDTLP